MKFVQKESAADFINHEASTGISYDRIEYDGEVKIIVDGAEFPLKTAPSSDSLFALNIVKKTVVESLKMASLRVFYPSYALILLFAKKNTLQAILEAFVRIGYGAMEPYMYYRYFKQDKPINLTKSSCAVGKITELFLVNYGITQDISHKTSELIAHIFELDGFYRFKLLDIMSLADKSKMLYNPRREIQRLIKICSDREQIIGSYIRPKLAILSKAAWLLSIPSIRNAFIAAIKETDFSWFTIDDSDFYWMSVREDYFYFGNSPTENMDNLKNMGYKIPIFEKV